MLYFSEIVGKKVLTEDNIPIGKLEDILFVSENVPLVSKLVINGNQGKKIYVPIEYLKNINHKIFIYKNYITDDIGENELYVHKNLLDKQIIDLSGDKIVRVNDVAIQNKPNYYIAGADIGVLGILRRLKVEEPIIKLYHFFRMKLAPKFLSWAEIQPLELSRGYVKLKKEEEKMKKLRPEDLASYLDETNISNVKKILDILDEKKAADVIGKLNISYQTALFKQFQSEKAVRIISVIDPDNAVDILLTLSRKKRENILKYTHEKEKKQIVHLLKYAGTTIGDLITSEYLTVSSDNKVNEFIERIKKETIDFYYIEYIYVVNSEGQLVGVFSLHELLMQNSDTQIYKFMTQNVIVLHLTTPEEIAINMMLKYKLHALPVIDNEKKIIGIVTIDDLANIILKKIRL